MSSLDDFQAWYRWNVVKLLQGKDHRTKQVVYELNKSIDIRASSSSKHSWLSGSTHRRLLAKEVTNLPATCSEQASTNCLLCMWTIVAAMLSL
jgi:hypothetical protein